MWTFLALLVAIAAFILAYVAYKKSGGSVDELKKQVEDLGLTTESLRGKTADILENLEKKVRGEEKKADSQTGDADNTFQDKH
ncbi:MAG: hypothetical protein WCQ99_09330 [Pseudomonadota bacterium]